MKNKLNEIMNFHNKQVDSSIRTMAEDNADEYVKNNPLPDND